MASASSSASIPPRRSCTYHVFLSFRGEDTRTGFTGHLYAALNRKGITTYKDDKNLRKGHVISKELLKAIEESMFAVIVFSRDYAFSSWCLDELQKIIECQNQVGLQIKAVFYGVEPCDVRHQRGTFEEAFKKHEERHDREKVKRWREALTQVAAHSGWTSKNKDEAVLVENIAQHIFEILIPKLPSSMKNLVGINSRVKQVITLLGLGLNDVRFIGIWGMGGMGKTTIARAVFETIRCRFEVTCFLADVRENCEKKDITHLQKQLLDQMNISSNAVHNKYDGRTVIQNSLHLKKVLLVVDDVNHEKQLEDLAGERDWFGPGSRIIITTRDVEVLKGPEVHETYKVEGLVESEALNLFCLKAFKQQEPTEGFLDLSEEVVKYSGGLPLALKVLGPYLNGRPTIAVWYSAIERIKKSSHSEIIDVLKISYEGLEDTEKDIFLDIACFFKGWEKHHVTEILKRCGHDAEIGIDILINRSLITIDKYDYDYWLGMHDLLEEMGKRIVIQESQNDVCKRSRLWCLEDVEFVLTQKKKTKATHGIVLHKKYSETEVNRRDLSFSKMCQLKLLILDGVKAPILCDIPCTLKVFRWRYCPLKTLPLTDHQRYELVEINLSYSKIVELWDGKKVLKKLEHLFLSWCNLTQTPDLFGAPNLKKLDLSGCVKLDYIHPSLVHHKRLVELNLSYCRSLETLGEKLEMSLLEKLDLYECSSLRRLPDLSGAPNLKKLDLWQCVKLDYIHPSLAHHKRLVELNLGECRSLETLGDKLEMSLLEKLDLRFCSSLRRLPDLSGAPNLKKLDLEKFEELDYIHPSLAHHKRLVELNLGECKSLETLGQKLEMSLLEKLDLFECSSLRGLPDLSGAPNLKKLSLWNCKKLDYIHPSLAHHKRIVELNLRQCGRLETLGDKLEMSSLEKLDLYSCSSLRRLPEFGECMKQLSILNLTGTGIEELSPTLGNLAGVSELYLTWCYKITGLLLSLGCFVGLKKLVLGSLPEKTDGLESLTVRADYDDSDSSSLSSLTLSSDIGSSREESTLSNDIGHLASLTDLDLSESSFLRVPITIHQLPRLTRLDLSYCKQLEVLPELPSSLRELDARDCYSLDASNVDDVISKACCGFAESSSQDREDVLQMLIHGKEIPAWFEHQEEGSIVSVSFPQNCPSIETIALALCFLIEIEEDIDAENPSVICNGKEFINASLDVFDCSDHLFIVCVNGYYFSKLLCQHNRFQLVSSHYHYHLDIGRRYGAHWVTKQDVEGFKKTKSKTGKRKATMDIISHSSPSTSGNKMLVVAPPQYEQEEEPTATAEGPIRHLASRKSSHPPPFASQFS
ncbi:disease resistance protein Roq1-like [Arachis duranensis]|uniref:ADP-ribosyl cyclase/cyclic ADP-ribose hydrolase n=1 Tax=Arachis duranensis TaxID=130453 RepID=A0A9C6TWC8_ARADU|nr:disease resistance protein Roq1-like [Arachis duranensis]